MYSFDSEFHSSYMYQEFVNRMVLSYIKAT